jgi:ribose transport system ATP-binding protein
MNEIFRVSDEISVLWNGKIVASQPTSSYTMQSLIHYMMGEDNEKTMVWKERTSPIGGKVLVEVSNLSIAGKLDKLSFSVHEGEVLGFAGLMGSGRTEILECIFGKRKYSSGMIKIDGQPARHNNIRQAVKCGIALVPEDRRRQGLVLTHPLKDNVISTNYGSVVRRGVISKKRVKSVSEQAISDFAVKADGIMTRMSNLSGGNQQKIVIAKWMNTQPKVLLMDEPTAGVDIGAKSEIIEIIREFIKRGNAVIFVSSELSEMMAICDRIIVLSNGRISSEFSQQEIHSEEVLQHAIQQ